MHFTGAVLAVFVFVLAAVQAQEKEKKDPPLESFLINAVKEKDHAAIQALLKDGADPNQAWTPREDYRKSVLHIAIDNEDQKSIRMLLDAGADPWAECQNGYPAFFWPNEEDELTTLKFLVDYGVDINGKNSEGNTFLHDLYPRHPSKLLEFLLKLGAYPNVRDEKGRTPLMTLKGGDEKGAPFLEGRIGLLIKYGADLNLQDPAGETALMFKLDNYDHKIQARALLDAGSDVRIRTQRGRDALMVAIGSWDGRKLVPEILAKDPDFSIVDEDGNSAFLLALRTGQTELAGSLIEKGSQIDLVNQTGQTALHFAAQIGDLDLIKRFLAAGLDAKAVDNQKSNAFHYLAEGMLNTGEDADRLQAVLETLVKAGADPFAASSEGNAPLHLAASFNPPLTRLLLEKGADPEVKNRAGDTPLSLAVHQKKVDSVSHLLGHGADPDARAGDGGTALHVAVERTNSELTSALLKAGADPNLARKDGTLPLHLAAASFHGQRLSPEVYGELVEALLKVTRNPGAADGEGITPLMWVAATDRPDLIELFLARGADPDTQAHDGRTAAMWAAVCGADQALASLKKAGADWEIRDGKGRTAEDWRQFGPEKANLEMAKLKAAALKRKPVSIADAAASGDGEFVAAWISRNPGKINDPDVEFPPLHLAAMHGRTGIVNQLLEAGADPGRKTESGEHALHWAAANGHAAVVEQLLEAGAPPDVRGNRLDGNPLTLAVRYGHEQVVVQLLESGADASIDGGQSLISAMNRGSLAQLNLLLDHGADPLHNVNREAPPRSPDPFGDGQLRAPADITPVSRSGYFGDPAFLTALLDKLPEPLSTNDKKRLDRALNRAMYQACLEGHDGMVRYLVGELDVDVNLNFTGGLGGVTRVAVDVTEDLEIYTPLSLVIEHGRPQTVRFLLEAGAVPRGRTRSAQPPLIFALEGNRSELVDLLLEFDASVEAPGYGGTTPLMNVARRGDLAQAKRLIGEGAKVGAVTPFRERKDSWGPEFRMTDGVTAFLVSCYAGKTAMAAYLIDQGSDLKQTDGQGRGAWHAAVLGKEVEMCEWLLEKGLDTNEPVAKNGERPLETAARVASEEIIRFLLENGARKSESALKKAEEAERDEAILELLK